MKSTCAFHAAQLRTLSELIDDIAFRAQLLTFQSQMLPPAAHADMQWHQLVMDAGQLSSLTRHAASIARALTRD